MSINFGYGGYGMNMGMTPMQNQQSNNGSNPYNCRMCYMNGATPYNHKTFINPIPRAATTPSFFEKFIRKVMGG